MVGPFLDFDDWVNFYQTGAGNPAVQTDCETGGRLLHWLGYQVLQDTPVFPPPPEHFRHVSDNSSLLLGLGGIGNPPWRGSQPNAKKNAQCLTAYLGLEPDAAWYDLSCETVRFRLLFFSRAAIL